MHFAVKLNKSLNVNNLFVYIITSENDNKQYLIPYFYNDVAFLRIFFIKVKELARSVSLV